jgi:hypothetical protein
MDFLGTLISALLLLLFILNVINIYCIYYYYKLDEKIDNMYFLMDLIKKNLLQSNQVSSNCLYKMNHANENKEINILPENFIYYPESSSSLIEVSSDDNSTYESDSDYEDVDYDSDDCKIKNVHMSLNLENLEDIHVSLLDEIANTNTNKDDYLDHNKLIELDNLIAEDNQIKVDDILIKVDGNQIETNNIQIVSNNNPVEEIVSELSEPKELIFKPKKRESRKNMGDGDYKKMNLTDLRKYLIENNINIDASKMKKTEILRVIEELKKNVVDESFTNVVNESFTNGVDSSFTNVVDSSFTNVVDSSFTNVVDESFTNVVDSSFTNGVDESFTNGVDSSFTNVVDESFTNVVDESFTNVVNELL